MDRPVSVRSAWCASIAVLLIAGQACRRLADAVRHWLDAWLAGKSGR